MDYLNLLSRTNYWGGLGKAVGKPRIAYIDRLVEQRATRNVSAVMGVRRAGKSTILQHTLEQLINKQGVKPENTLLINLEDPRLFDILTGEGLFRLIDAFKEMADLRSDWYLVLDEVQNLQKWESVIRSLLDQEKRLKIYVTGSSARLLGRELGTKLAGRYIKTEVFPLSFVEYKSFGFKNLTNYINMGGFPDPVLTKDDLMRAQLLKDYYESILLRDIAARYKIRDVFKLRSLTSRLFANISNQASSYRFSKDLDLVPDTILQFFGYIEDAYLGFFVPKYAHSVRKQGYNPKKFYCIDNGLQSAVSFRVIDDLGKLFENSVFLELRRKFDQIFYWQDEKEVDFVVKEKERVKFILNACVSIVEKETREREIMALMEAMYVLDLERGYLVVMEGEEQVIEVENGRILVVRYDDLSGVLDL